MSQTFDLDWYWTDIDGSTTWSGLMTKRTTGQSGKFGGSSQTTPPNAVTTPTGGSCLTGTATTFLSVGVIAGTTTI
jgi:hypothetical protein